MTIRGSNHSDVLARIKWAFRNNGEWVLLGLFCFLCASGGYSMAAWQFKDAVQENQRHADERLTRKEDEWADERKYFRATLDSRNRQLVAKNIAYEQLTKILADQGVLNGQAAKSSASAAETATKTLQTISAEKDAK
jgi:hypothetical protein